MTRRAAGNTFTMVEIAAGLRVLHACLRGDIASAQRYAQTPGARSLLGKLTRMRDRIVETDGEAPKPDDDDAPPLPVQGYKRVRWSERRSA